MDLHPVRLKQGVRPRSRVPKPSQLLFSVSGNVPWWHEFQQVGRAWYPPLVSCIVSHERLRAPRHTQVRVFLDPFLIHLKASPGHSQTTPAPNQDMFLTLQAFGGQSYIRCTEAGSRRSLPISSFTSLSLPPRSRSKTVAADSIHCCSCQHVDPHAQTLANSETHSSWGLQHVYLHVYENASC